MKKYIWLLLSFVLVNGLSWRPTLAVNDTIKEGPKKVSWSDHGEDADATAIHDIHVKNKKKKTRNPCPEKSLLLGTSAVCLIALLAPSSVSLWGITEMAATSIPTNTVTAYAYVPGGYANSSLLKPSLEIKPLCTYEEYFHSNNEPLYTNGSCLHIKDEYSCIVEDCSTIQHLYTKAKNTALVSAIVSLAAKWGAIGSITAWAIHNYGEAQKEPELIINI